MISSLPTAPAVIIHGGAGALPLEQAKRKLPGLRRSLDATWEELLKNEDPLSAVEAGLRVLEADEFFNAGFGSYPDEEGNITLDVGLMRGEGEFSSIANITKLIHPSSVAYDFLKKGSVRSLVWNAELQGRLFSLPEEIKSRYRCVQLEEEMLAPSVKALLTSQELGEVDEHHGTVGVVVRSPSGRLAAGTSTGGTKGKPLGRIGDSPIIGAGFYADNEIGALSATGHGESLMRSLISSFILHRMREGIRQNSSYFHENPTALSQIIYEEISEMNRKCGGRGGGVIVLPCKGAPSWGANSLMMSSGIRVMGEGNTAIDEVFIASRKTQAESFTYLKG